MKAAPRASSTNTGKAPAHLVVQGIGTPASKLRFAVAAIFAERGCA